MGKLFCKYWNITQMLVLFSLIQFFEHEIWEMVSEPETTLVTQSFVKLIPFFFFLFFSFNHEVYSKVTIQTAK